MRYSINYCIIIAILGGFLSCNKNTIEDFDVEFGYEYFPLEIGQSKQFAVDSIVFDPSRLGMQADTLSGFFREDIVDTLRNNAGELVYRVERYYRRNSSLSWQIHSVVAKSRNEQEALFTESNLKYVKLLFPLKTTLEWSSTAYFPETTEIEVAGEVLEYFKGWKSNIVEKRDQFLVDQQTYSDVFLVELANFENKIEYRYGLEAYAPNEGLVYQEIWVLDTQCERCCNNDLGACDPLPWVEKAEKGLILKKRLIK